MSALAGLDLAAKEEELRAKEKAGKEEAKPKATARRSNSFTRRKKKTEDGGAADDSAAAEPAKPSVKVEEQSDPLCEALQKEALELDAAEDYDAAGEKWYYLAEAAHNSGDLRREALAMQNMGTSLVNMGQLEQAFACYDRALHLAEEVEYVPAQIDALLMLKWLFQEVGALSNATRCCEEVLTLLAAVNDLPATGQVLLELGQLHALQEDWEQATLRLEEAHKAVLEHRAEEKSLQAAILLELANATLELADPEGALAHHEAALDVAKTSDDDELKLRTRHDMAMLLLHCLHRDDDARKLLEEMIGESRQIQSSAAEPTSRAAMHAMEMEGRACIELCPLLLRADAAAAAVAIATRGVELATTLEIDEALGVCHTQMADCLIAENKTKEALEHLALSRDIWRRIGNELHVEFVTQTRRSAANMRENQDLLGLLDQSAKDTYLKLAYATLADSPDAISDALFAVEEGRGVITEQMLSSCAPPAEEEPETPAVLPTLPPQFDANAMAALNGALYGEGARASAGAIIYFSIDGSAAEVKPKKDGAQPPAELLSWLILADGSVTCHRAPAEAPAGFPLQERVWTVMEKLRLMAHPMSKRGIEMGEEQVSELRARHADADGDIDADLQHLSDALLKPFFGKIEPGTPITLIPHSFLHMVPFGALPLPSGEPLVAAHPLTQAASLGVLMQMALRDAAAAEMAERKGALVLSAPETAEEDMLPSMPFALSEGEAVAAATGAAPETTLAADNATLPALLLALDEPLETVHLSAHMPQRYIVLAAKRKSPKQADDATAAAAEGEGEGEEDDDAPGSWMDRTMDIDRVKSLWLRTHPDVVLGGSYGGTGALSQDGVLGLPRAFLAAGARSVLATLWDAVDEPTAELLKRYHANKAKGASGAQALREAVLALREADNAKWRHPLYWAGFVLTGTCKP